MPLSSPVTTTPLPDGLPRLQRQVLQGLALAAHHRTRNWVHAWLGLMGAVDEHGRRCTLDAVKAAMDALARSGAIVQDHRRFGYWAVAPVVAPQALLDVLAERPPATLRQALAEADGYGADHFAQRVRWPSLEAALARLRLDATLGATLTELESQRLALPWGAEWAPVLDVLCASLTHEALYPRLHPSLQATVLTHALQGLLAQWAVAPDLDVPAACAALLAHDDGPDTFALRSLWAQYLLQADRPGDVAAALAPLHAAAGTEWPAAAQALACAVPALQADWPAAESAFEAALVVQRRLLGKRRGVMPLVAVTQYVLALLAQGAPAQWEKALKLCLTEGGSREPKLDTPVGVMAHAIQMRSGQAAREPARLRPFSHGGHVSPLDWWRWLMRAWLKEGLEPEPLSAPELDALQRLQVRLKQAGLLGLLRTLEAAAQVLRGEPPPPGCFLRPPQEAWQAKLDALRALVQPGAPAPEAAPATPAATRLLWQLDVDEHGAVQGLQAFEQTAGARGWNKPRPATLAKLHRTAQALPAHDAAVARCVRQEGGLRDLRFDLAAATAALVGHPHLTLAERPGETVDLREGRAELDVRNEGERLLVRMQPPLHDAPAGLLRHGMSPAATREAEALRALSVLRDGPQRAHLVRLTPEQVRVAQLLGRKGLDIPRQAAAQLQEVLGGLGAHFQIHADDDSATQPAREVPAEARLRAELTPLGGGLQLRLVAAPFGADHPDGPRLTPGRGRARVLATLGGQALGVQRQLDVERQHLDSLLDACPMLAEPPPDGACEWTLDEAEATLTLIERLRQHHAVLALDWPQGKAMRVDSAGLGALQLQVKSNQDWLAVQGELKLDEHLVMSLQQLIGFANVSKSRFVPLGQGRYLALTQELRARLDDLAAVAARPDATRADLRVPPAATGWVAELLQAAQDAGANVQRDAATLERLRRLAQVQDAVPVLPATLQADLRPYQEEGFAWAMRLAAAGLGACLADDMGLGKTLQALAVLLARASGGPALVVAPTSLMGNWQAEARRFAPSLQVQVYAESDRAQAVAQAGPHSVLLVSYQLLQQDAQAFAGVAWHTLVLDEAQAIKNAAAKRSQAVFGLQADFRLALSGTPIENRLGELWSVMQAINPGLLGTAARFNQRFAGLIERQKDRHAQRTLRRLVHPFILRRTKAQVLDDLPPRTELVWPVQPEERERAHYEALRRDALEAAQKALSGNAAGQAHLNVLAQLTRLRRAACDPRLVTPSLGWPGAKVQAFGDLAAELVANGHKALVFSQFVDFLALLREPLDAAGIAYQYLDGSTPAPERTRRVAAFQAGEGHLFLISLKAGGFGLNLTVADYVVIADPWWNPAAEDQAAGRAHRIGQQRPVTVYRLVNQGTLESRMLELHHHKRELADTVLAGDDDSAPGALVDPDELVALMRG